MNTACLTYRKATRKDKELFIKLGFELRAAEGVPVPPDQTKHYRKRFIDFIDTWYWNVYFVSLDERPIGFITYRFIQRASPKNNLVCFLQHLFVQEPFRKQGYGKQAMAWLEQECQKEGATEIELFVLADNKQALKFYSDIDYAYELIQMRKRL